MSRKIIVPQFQEQVAGLIAEGATKYSVAKRLGVSRPTIRRALAALAAGLAEAGAAHAVDSMPDVTVEPSAIVSAASWIPACLCAGPSPCYC